jgi:DNA-binding HxlR family transcriptional regulator
MEDQTQVEKDRQRAEVFDALGHPTRILILKVLSEGALGFADLKKKTGIESSGHLQHHLTKLNGLIKTDEYGKYCLSDEGQDALLTVQTVENASSERDAKAKEHKHFRLTLKPVAFLLATLLIVSSVIALYEYNQAADNSAALLREKFTKADEIAGAYIDQHGTQHIILTNNATTKAINAYLYIAGNGTAIVFENADFPLSYLYAVQDSLDGVMIKFGIESTGINEIANKVDIHLLNSTKQQDVIDFLKTVFNNFDDRCVAFMDPVGIRLTATENSPTVPPESNIGFPAAIYGAIMVATIVVTIVLGTCYLVFIRLRVKQQIVSEN